MAVANKLCMFKPNEKLDLTPVKYMSHMVWWRMW